VEHHSLERQGGLYNGDDGREYGDNLFRFTLLSLAALEAPLILNIGGRGTYGDKVLFLANDWQAGLVPLYLTYKYRRNGCYQQARAIYVVHNLGYQGQYHGVNACNFFGIDQQAVSDIALGSAVNLSKGALVCADRVLTVSPNYAKEIQTPQGGFNLQDFVRAKGQAGRLAGILNGIDDCWNPLTDTSIAQRYTLVDFESGKRANKVALQKFLGLDEDPEVVLLGFVGRLTWQKGVDILGSIISWMMQDTGNGVTGRSQLIMMGNGEAKHAETLRWAESTYKGRVCGYVGFDPKVEHQMMAGCDLFLMPSRYEPCGLPQMESQQYGTLPIVVATGGLVDSVKDISEGIDTATGFHVPYLAADKLKETVYKAMEIYYQRPADFKCMQKTAMSTDFYWPAALDVYEQLIDVALYEPPTNR
jgi:starch synthase